MLVNIIRAKDVKGARANKPDLTYGSSSSPNDRASFAKVVLGVTSGKGGVGKSTVTVNLAVALAQRGLAVGILDADVYGPSVPRMLQLHGERVSWGPAAAGGDKMIPAENFGVKVMSTALTSPEDDTAFAWRSSVATSALIQLLEDVDWGALDVLLIDMPPGTGDVQITMVQEVRLTAALVVTTPQQVATDDVRRAMRMLQDVRVPIAGVIENMSYLDVPGGPRMHPFGQGGGRGLADRYRVPLLAELPLSQRLRSSSDDGAPIVATGDEDERAPWRKLAADVLALPGVRARLLDAEGASR
jgi:ATP-binding protein involved in chromosome partitioning